VANYTSGSGWSSRGSFSTRPKKMGQPEAFSLCVLFALDVKRSLPKAPSPAYQTPPPRVPSIVGDAMAHATSTPMPTWTRTRTRAPATPNLALSLLCVLLVAVAAPAARAQQRPAAVRPGAAAATASFTLTPAAAAACQQTVFAGLATDCNLNGEGSYGACCATLASAEVNQYPRNSKPGTLNPVSASP